MRRTTRRKTRKTATVEGLHASFEKIDSKVRTMIETNKSDTDLACCIRKAWSEQFHTGISNPAITGMIIHYRAVYGGRGNQTRNQSRKHTRKHGKKHQSGGMAPLGYETAPGTTASTYGQFHPSIATSVDAMKGLEIDRLSTCNSAAEQRQVGGDLSTALGYGHLPFSVPSTAVGGVLGALAGSTTPFAGAPYNSSPVAPSVQTQMPPHPPFNPAGFASITKFLTNPTN